MKKRISSLLVVLAVLFTVGCSRADEPICELPLNIESEVNEDYTLDTSATSEVKAESTLVDDTENYNYEKTGWPDHYVSDYIGEPYVTINNNVPFFTEEEITTEVFETYSELDSLGRCGVAFANICKEIMPTEDRGAIGHVKPSGWHTVKYDIVDGKYLYNRCHLIGFQLAGENANELNLITGTRYLNIDGMLEHENMIAEYVKETGNHVLYRVTPVYRGDNLVATGVQMEAYSVEDNGEGIKFNIFAYNVQPGIQIDYLTGESKLIGDTSEIEVKESKLGQYTENSDSIVYTVNINTKKFHYEDCSTAIRTKEENKESFNGTINWLLDNGYEPCGKCNPK